MSVTHEELIDGQDFYGDDHDIAVGETDAISDLIGAAPFVAGQVLDDCQQTFPDGGVLVDPETFDRWYFTVGEQYIGLLVDVLRGDSEEERAAERAAKNVAFKTGWCAEHKRPYVVIVENDVYSDPGTVRAQIAAALGQPIAAPAPAATAVEVTDEPRDAVTDEPTEPAVAERNPLAGIDLAAEGFDISEEHVDVPAATEPAAAPAAKPATAPRRRSQPRQPRPKR